MQGYIPIHRNGVDDDFVEINKDVVEKGDKELKKGDKVKSKSVGNDEWELNWSRCRTMLILASIPICLLEKCENTSEKFETRILNTTILK